MGGGHGDGLDTINAGAGADRVALGASDNKDTFVLSTPPTGPAQLVREEGGLQKKLTGVETLDLCLGGGDDVFTNGTTGGTPIAVQVDGGAGNDNLYGTSGADVLDGSYGNDSIFGGAGADSVTGGPGDDRMEWGSATGGADVLDGSEGTDLIAFFGSKFADQLDIAPGAAGSIRLGSPAGPAAEARAVERIDTTAGDGDDAVRVADGIPAAIDLGVDGGSGSDVVTTTGSDGTDSVRIASIGPAFQVTRKGGSRGVEFAGIAFRATETLDVRLLGGSDNVDAGDGLRGSTTLRIDGGAGSDVLAGSDSDDLLIGGPGLDRMDGRAGVDSYQCSGPGDLLTAEPQDIVAADCG